MSDTVDCHNCGTDLEKEGFDVSDEETPYWSLTRSRQSGEFTIVENLPFCSDECARQHLDQRIADDAGMTLAEAAFEYAAAFADFHELATSDRDMTSKELVAQVESAYDLDEANATLDAAGVTRNVGEQDDFEPFAVRVKDREFPDWRCRNCGNRPRLKFEERPPCDCSYCGANVWTTEEPQP